MANLEWRPSLIADESTGSSDKTLNVPNRITWHLLSIWAELTSSATTGNRQLEIEIQDTAGDILAELHSGAVQAAGVTRYYLFAPDMMDLTSARDTDFFSSPLPSNIILPQGFAVRIFDNGAIANPGSDATPDDLIIQMLVEQRGERRQLTGTAN